MSHEADNRSPILPLADCRDANGEQRWQYSFRLGSVEVSIRVFRRRFELVIREFPTSEGAAHHGQRLAFRRLNDQQRRCG